MNASPIDAKPPYGGFGTFWNFIQQLHEHRPLPQILDRSVMGNRGGSSRAELYIALRFFGLIDENKAPTETLEVVTMEPDATKLRGLVQSAYAPVIALNLATATPRQVDDALAGLGATPSTVSRSRAFLLNACEAAGIEFGRLLQQARVRGGSPGSQTRAVGSRARATRRTTRKEPPPPVTALPPLVAALLADLPASGEEWDVASAQRWLSLFVPALAYGYNLNVEEIKVDP
jgi:hypothetical protein